MSVVVVLSTPNTDSAPDSAPRRIVRKRDTVEIEIVHFERKQDCAMPYLWVRKTSLDAFEQAVQADDMLSDLTCLDAEHRAGFYRVTWDVDSPLPHCVQRSNGLIMDATGTSDAWRLNIWFADSAHASQFQRYCEQANIPLTIRRLTSMGDQLVPSPTILTEKQREALLLAFDRGYFQKPRAVTQRELSEELGVSSSAVGRRLRLGCRNLIQEMSTSRLTN